MKYNHRDIGEVDAYQFIGDGDVFPEWITEKDPVIELQNDTVVLKIPNVVIPANPSDYIVRQTNGIIHVILMADFDQFLHHVRQRN